MAGHWHRVRPVEVAFGKHPFRPRIQHYHPTALPALAALRISLVAILLLVGDIHQVVDGQPCHAGSREVHRQVCGRAEGGDGPRCSGCHHRVEGIVLPPPLDGLRTMRVLIFVEVRRIRGTSSLCAPTPWSCLCRDGSRRRPAEAARRAERLAVAATGRVGRRLFITNEERHTFMGRSGLLLLLRKEGSVTLCRCCWCWCQCIVWGLCLLGCEEHREADRCGVVQPQGGGGDVGDVDERGA
mmetsp:Transcript_8783/g.21563  ORF Transcript_8783/g.21563 Transcript_8783/m.21563 type:complete len:241 (-) Transcript_8783:535-1257(-)